MRQLQLTSESQAGKEVINLILTGNNVFPFIGMNLRTFTPGGGFFSVLGRFTMIDAGNAVEGKEIANAS